MTTDQIFISSILFIALILFAWGRWRYDLVAMFCLIASVLVGVVPDSSHPTIEIGKYNRLKPNICFKNPSGFSIDIPPTYTRKSIGIGKHHRILFSVD